MRWERERKENYRIFVICVVSSTFFCCVRRHDFINKTPLSFRTNRIIGGVAPSEYLAKLEKGDKHTPAIHRDRLNAYLRSHLIDPEVLRKDDFYGFMADRQRRLLGLIEQATGKAAYSGSVTEEGEDVDGDVDGDVDMIEAEMVISP